jgi:uncharacterized protein YndB with AHSA1/START domain
MNPKPAPTSALTLKRLIKAPIARVFAAWTTPEDMLQWFGPGPWKVITAKLDLRPGGSWRVCFHSDAENRDVEVYGVYREVRPNTRLVFTWNSENPQMNFGETLVTVDLTDASGSTNVCITHEGFPAQPIQERHALGWQHCCDNLEKLLGQNVTLQ